MTEAPPRLTIRARLKFACIKALISIFQVVQRAAKSRVFRLLTLVIIAPIATVWLIIFAGRLLLVTSQSGLLR
jgi:hypothetical protein